MISGEVFNYFAKMANVGDENVSQLIPSLGEDKIGKYSLFEYFKKSGKSLLMILVPYFFFQT